MMDRDGSDFAYDFIQDLCSLCERHQVLIGGADDGSRPKLWFERDGSETGFILDLGSLQDLVNRWKGSGDGSVESV
jgi:hypothetical protein